MPPVQNRGSNMSLNKKLNILLILTSIAFGLLFVIMILGYFFPGEPSPNQEPWFVLAAIGEMIAMIIATFTIGFIVQKKIRKQKSKTKMNRIKRWAHAHRFLYQNAKNESQ